MRKDGLGTLRVLAFLILGALVLAIVLRWVSLERWHWQMTRGEELETAPTPAPSATIGLPPTPGRPQTLSGKFDLARLFNGITLRSEVETTNGGAASDERVDPMSYVVDLKLKARVPAPNRSVEELKKVNAELGNLLPGLATMIKPESVSPLFGQLYETKVRALRENLNRLDWLLSRHNFFDCQTVLSLKGPETKRRALLLQADMDVDSDGSDGDRLPAGSGVSPNFKPFTSFRWTKKSERPNPYLPGTEEKLRRAEMELKLANVDRKRELKNSVNELRDEVAAMKKYSYLIGTYDPFIVVPGNFLRGPDATKVGDYAVVVAEKMIFPAIVGDVGPNDKVGEASLRIAKEISSVANPNYRPISELKATYIIFNNTADASFGPPDLEKLQTICESLVKEIGGASVPLHHWENSVPPLPTPTPTPAPTPAPAETVSPSASPSATFAFPTPTPTPSASP